MLKIVMTFIISNKQTNILTSILFYLQCQNKTRKSNIS